ncbi:hypothetical protein K469DRAFT_602423 [Zopfia rhizophila CBS 207.26]|uniref:HTH CENPB-type domain-containing protein n=1 Tax=Zopfia rhizophila CBS 207.26 TaxID=1314779 RepID=A0A6A6DDQ3_9PEZI|nr:hypothetical protein K469DRAFT_602423 [Zopfia rhizophila CBS 207.26]
MDPASIALSEGREPNEPRTYTALSERHNVSHTTLWNRAHGLPSIREKAESQQYLTPTEEKALARYLIQMSDIGYPVLMKCIRSLAFIIARQRSATAVTIKPLDKNWPKAFEKRHPELHSRKSRYDNNIYDKITHWFEVIGKELQDPAIQTKNVYNMDETGVMLCMLSSVKVLISKNDSRNYRGAGVKRTMVTTIS